MPTRLFSVYLAAPLPPCLTAAEEIDFHGISVSATIQAASGVSMAQFRTRVAGPERGSLSKHLFLAEAKPIPFDSLSIGSPTCSPARSLTQRALQSGTTEIMGLRASKQNQNTIPRAFDVALPIKRLLCPGISRRWSILRATRVSLTAPSVHNYSLRRRSSGHTP
jgi:hypothetical protein